LSSHVSKRLDDVADYKDRLQVYEWSHPDSIALGCAWPSLEEHGTRKNQVFIRVTVRMAAGYVHKGFWWEELMERDNLEDLGVNGRIILKAIFKKWDGES
jgi:hypothetical protein